MERLLINRIITILVLSIFSFSVLAGSLSQGSLDQYIQSMELLKNSTNKEIISIRDGFQNNTQIKFDVDEQGNIAIMSQAIKQLDDSKIGALNKVIKAADYNSIDTWTKVGDKIAAAMMAFQMKKEPTDLSQMTPDMLAAMPESMRAQIEGAMRMMKAAQKVPEGDIALIKANYSKLQNLMQ